MKGFNCEEEDCDYKCSQRGSLNVHVKSFHLKIKDFICQECDHQTCTKASLNTNVNVVHLKLKNHKCLEEGCDLKCTQRYILDAYVKRVVHL